MVRCIDVVNLDGTLVKLYAAHGDAAVVSPALTTAMLRFLRLQLQSKPHGDVSDGVAFATVAPTRTGTWVTFDRWFGETALLHSAFQGGVAAPYAFQPTTHGDEVLPAWYVKVLEFERLAWQSAVLDHLDDPDFAGYLAARYASAVIGAGGA